MLSRITYLRRLFEDMAFFFRRNGDLLHLFRLLSIRVFIFLSVPFFFCQDISGNFALLRVAPDDKWSRSRLRCYKVFLLIFQD